MTARIGREPEVVVADSDPDIGEIVRVFLKKEEYETSKASNGSEFLEMMKKYDPDLVLLEMDPEGLNGWELLEYAKEKGLMDSEIVLTLTSEVNPVQFLRNEGIKWISGQIKKPIEKANLLSKVRDRIKRKREVDSVRRKISRKNKHLSESLVNYSKRMMTHEFISRKLREIYYRENRFLKTRIETLVRKEKHILTILRRKIKDILGENELLEYSELVETDLDLPKEFVETGILDEEELQAPNQILRGLDSY